MAADRSPAPAPPPRRRIARAGAARAALALVAVLALPRGLWALLRSEAGTRWLLPRVPGLEVDGVQGACSASGCDPACAVRWAGGRHG